MNRSKKIKKYSGYRKKSKKSKGKNTKKIRRGGGKPISSAKTLDQLYGKGLTAEKALGLRKLIIKSRKKSGKLTERKSLKGLHIQESRDYCEQFDEVHPQIEAGEKKAVSIVNDAIAAVQLEIKRRFDEDFKPNIVKSKEELQRIIRTDKKLQELYIRLQKLTIRKRDIEIGYYLRVFNNIREKLRSNRDLLEYVIKELKKLKKYSKFFKHGGGQYFFGDEITKTERREFIIDLCTVVNKYYKEKQLQSSVSKGSKRKASPSTDSSKKAALSS